MVAGCTLFYSVTFYNMYASAKGGNTQKETAAAQEQQVAEEDESSYPQFEDPYSDAAITQEVKDLLNGITLSDSVSTGAALLDNRVSSMYNSTSRFKKDNYDKIRVAYDYMLKNFMPKEVEEVDDKALETLCQGVSYIKDFDMNVAFRANRLFEEAQGDTMDFACAFTAILRKSGVEAYYVSNQKFEMVTLETGESSTVKLDVTQETDRGYTVVKIGADYYVFDPAMERAQMKSDTDNPKYEYFCKKLDMAGTDYQQEDVDRYMQVFGGFAAYPAMKFSAMITNKNYSMTQNISFTSGINSKNIAEAEGNLHVYVGDTINFAGTVSSTGQSNVWKLVATIYDRDMDYVSEQVVSNSSTDSAYNEASYTTTQSGYVQLDYSVTDVYGRTVTITYTGRVYEDWETETTKAPATRPQEDYDDEDEDDTTEDDPFETMSTSQYHTVPEEDSTSNQEDTTEFEPEETTPKETEVTTTEKPTETTTEKTTETTTVKPTETTTEKPTETTTEAPSEPNTESPEETTAPQDSSVATAE